MSPAPAISNQGSELVRRPMSNAERSSWLLNEVASMQGAFVVRIAGSLEEDVLRQALRLAQQRHFMLRCHISPGPPAEFVEDLSEIPLTVKPWSERMWVDEITRQVDDPVPWQSGVLARAVLLNSREHCDLILAMHKSTHDGRSGVNVLRDVLEFAASIVECREPNLPVLSGVFDINDLVKKKSSLWALVPFFLRYFATIARKRPRQLTPDQVVPMGQIHTGLYPCLLTREETKSLRERCREQQTSIQGALAAAFLQAVAAEVCQESGASRVCVDHTATYDIRSLLEIPIDDSMANFASATISFHDAGPSVKFWDLARDVRNQIAGYIKSGLVLTMVRIQMLMSGSSQSGEQLSRRVEKLRKPATFITNFGQFDFPEKVGPWTREYQGAVISAKHFGGKCLSAVCMTASGRLSLNIFYAKPFFSQQRMEVIAGRVLDCLRS